MKAFACGAVVPGCQETFTAETEEEILEQVAEHAHRDHDMDDLTPELIAEVRAHIV